MNIYTKENVSLVELVYVEEHKEGYSIKDFFADLTLSEIASLIYLFKENQDILVFRKEKKISLRKLRKYAIEYYDIVSMFDCLVCDEYAIGKKQDIILFLLNEKHLAMTSNDNFMVEDIDNTLDEVRAYKDNTIIEINNMFGGLIVNEFKA